MSFEESQKKIEKNSLTEISFINFFCAIVKLFKRDKVKREIFFVLIGIEDASERTIFSLAGPCRCHIRWAIAAFAKVGMDS
jgi:hypothetical protein